MKLPRWAGLILLAGAAFAADPISTDEYRSRRAQLQKSLDGVLVLFGTTSRDTRDGWFQSPDFLYLTGWREPGAAILLTKSDEIIFLPERNERVERFDGKKVAPGDPDAAAKTGFARVAPIYKLQAEFQRRIEESPRVLTLTSDEQAQKLRPLAPFHTFGDARPMIARLRMKKSPVEIDAIQKATDASVAAHFAAWKRMAPGVYEYEVASEMMKVYRDKGCERSGYPPIVGSGPNAVILHYNENRRRMDSGDLLLMDVGAECNGYTTDITRTVPVNGKFTARQREIYEIVLGAQNAAIAAIKPGVRMSGEGQSLTSIAREYINSHGKDLQGKPLGRYFTHGLGHHVGLEVHDATDGVVLQPGMVITIEPGIYIPEESIGVRIEDMVLVTEAGAKIMSSALPREVAEIERVLGRK